MNRVELTERIVGAARKPMDDIVPAIRMRHKVTGKLHSIFGMPFNYKDEDYETVTIGCVFRDRNGTTYGTVEPTEQALRDRHALVQAHNDAQFRARLQEMSDERVAEQAAYWIKEVA